MSRFTFAVLASLLAGVAPSAARAQQVPGRDLLEFPLGLLAEAPTLSMRMPGGLWNPATIANLPPGARGSVGVAGLTTPSDQGIDLAMIAGEVRLRSNVTASVSYAQASVQDIFRTFTDPQTKGDEIPYGTNLWSFGAAAVYDNLSVGAAARFRSARFDDERASVVSLDAGAVMTRVARTPLRIAASTFLFSPSRSREAAMYSVAADLPVISRDTTFAVRGGYSFSHTEGRGREDYVFGTGSYHELDASAGVSQITAYGHTSQRLRLGLGLRYAEYTVSFGREDGAGGVTASYQMVLSRVIR